MKFQNHSMHGSLDMAYIKKRDTQNQGQPQSNTDDFLSLKCIFYP